MKTGFDNDKYLKTQSEHIRERIDMFGGKLYLEFGGKLFDDYHASRVLPGFHPDSKICMLMQLKDQAEAIITINSNDIEKNKMRGDLGITYDLEVLRLIDSFTDRGICVGGVVLTRYSGQHAAKLFEDKLRAQSVKVYHHYTIQGYPANIPLIVSDDGYGKNDFIETTHPLVVVTAPGPGSGKMAVCMSQLYHEQKRGIRAGYAKFETFPIWNLPLNHPVNIAYEAATADLDDKNMIDPFHLEAYGVTTVNYNRDVEIFPVVNSMLEKILGKSPYRSPTDMGVNMAGYCITDDTVVSKAARDEIIRRYFQALRDRKEGKATDRVVMEITLLMKQAGVSEKDRRVASAVRARMKTATVPVAAIELNDGTLVSGKAGSLLGASPAMILNALKVLAGIDDNVHLIAPEFINPVQKLKVDYLGAKSPRLDINDVLIALSIYANRDDNAAKAFAQIPKLKGCEVHMSVIPSSINEAIYRKLGVHLTCEPQYQTTCLFQKN
jgi:uncharacterized protein (UPF0371 family)